MDLSTSITKNQKSGPRGTETRKELQAGTSRRAGTATAEPTTIKTKAAKVGHAHGKASLDPRARPALAGTARRSSENKRGSTNAQDAKRAPRGGHISGTQVLRGSNVGIPSVSGKGATEVRGHIMSRSVSGPVGDTKMSPNRKSGAYKRKAKLRRQQAAQEQERTTETAGPSKRTRAEFSGEGDTSTAKKIRTSFRDALALVKMAIIPSGYPGRCLKPDHLMPIHELLTEKMEEAPDPLPNLLIAPSVAAGAVHVTCSDAAAARWLKEALHGAELEGLGLTVVEAKDLPKPVKMAWKSRNMALADTTRALRLLQRMNPSLRTSDWKVVNLLNEGTHTRRIVYMDRVSADVIKAANYCLPGGIDHCSFKLLEETKEQPRETEPPSQAIERREQDPTDEVVSVSCTATEEAEDAVSETDSRGTESMLGDLFAMDLSSPRSALGDEMAKEEGAQN